jgi:hypothetical protein
MGVEQTEIDALASLQPDLLHRIARDALGPFYDRTLNNRAWRAYTDWQTEAQSIVDAATDSNQIEQFRVRADAKLTELREELEAINDALRLDADDFDLPEMVVPEPELDDVRGEPLLDSRWSFAEQCRQLIASKAYRENGGAP